MSLPGFRNSQYLIPFLSCVGNLLYEYSLTHQCVKSFEFLNWILTYVFDADQTIRVQFNTPMHNVPKTLKWDIHIILCY